MSSFGTKILLIDDERNGIVDAIARNYDTGIMLLKALRWELLYLDHDLGDPEPGKTGYDILCFLESNVELIPKKIMLCTSNPVGMQKMRVVLAQFKEKGYIS